MIDIKPEDETALPTGQAHTLRVVLLPFAVRYTFDPEVDDAYDDELVLHSAGDDGFRRVIRASDEQHVTKPDKNVVEVTFPHVPDGVYSLYVDQKMDRYGREQEGYYLFEHERIPLVEGAVTSVDTPLPPEILGLDRDGVDLELAEEAGGIAEPAWALLEDINSWVPSDA